MTADFHEISERLNAIAEEIDDAVLERLRDAVEAGATKPSVDDKRLSRARNAVAKAAHLLRNMPQTD